MYIRKTSGISALGVEHYSFSGNVCLLTEGIRAPDEGESGLASILSCSSRKRGRVGWRSDRRSNRCQPEQTHLEGIRHFKLVENKQRRRNDDRREGVSIGRFRC